MRARAKSLANFGSEVASGIKVLSVCKRLPALHSIRQCLAAERSSTADRARSRVEA
jgi:hypothetical protein